MNSFALLLAVGACVAAAMLWPYVDRRLNGKPFDSELWRQGGRRRYLQVHDLCKSQRLQGLNRDEIRGLLGDPDVSSACSYVYRIDDKGSWMTNARFRVRFTEAGRVLRVRLEVGC